MKASSGKTKNILAAISIAVLFVFIPTASPAVSASEDAVRATSANQQIVAAAGAGSVSSAVPVKTTASLSAVSAKSGSAPATLASLSKPSSAVKKPRPRKKQGLPFGKMLVDLLKGLLVSTEIFVLTIVFSLPLGLAVAFGRMAKFPPLQWFFRIYISIMRGTPLMLQLFFFYFGPYYIFGIGLTSGYRFIACIIAFALNYAAYFAEIYRAGIEAIPIGQYEAGKVLGFTRSQTFLRIILPQVIKRIVPPVTNEVITLVKDTSLAFTLSVMEMFTCAKMAASAHTTMMPFIVAGVFYYIFNFIVAWAMERIEKSLGYYR